MVWMQLDWALGWKDSHTSLAHSYPQIVLLRKHMVMTHNASYNKQITSLICETGFLFHFGAIEKLLCHCSRPDSRCLCQPREHAANANTFSLRERQAELMIVLRPAPISHIKILSAGNKPWKVLVSIHWEITIISMQLCERFLMLCFCLVTFTVKNHTKKEVVSTNSSLFSRLVPYHEKMDAFIDMHIFWPLKITQDAFCILMLVNLH